MKVAPRCYLAGRVEAFREDYADLLAAEYAALARNFLHGYYGLRPETPTADDIAAARQRARADAEGIVGRILAAGVSGALVSPRRAPILARLARRLGCRPSLAGLESYLRGA